MSASKGTFSYAQAAKGLATSSSHSTKPTPPLPSTTEQKHSATPDSRRDSSQHDKGPHSSAMVESRLQKDVDSAEITKAGATVPEKDTSAPMNGMSPPASPEFGMSSTSTLVKEDDQSSAQPTSSDTTWDNKSTTSINGEQNLDQTEVSAEKGKSKDSRNGSEAEIESIQHNAMHDAPPPVENVWKKRAEARAAVQPIRPPTQTPKKMSGINSESADHAPELPSSGDRRRSAGPTTAVDEEHSKPSSRERKSNASPSARNQSEQGSGHRRRDQRSAEGRKGASSTRTSSRDEKVVSSPPLPPGRDEESWPTPETAEKEEKKKVQEKSEKPEKTEEDVPEKKKAHGKSAWKSVPFTPTVVFNTPLPSSGRRGGRGGGRGGRETSSRGGSSTAAIGDSTPAENTPTPLSSLPNGDQQRASKADATLNEESDTKASSISFREGSPSKASETTAVNTDTASINPREEYPTKPENMPNGHQRHLSNDQSQSGATSGTVRGSGSRGRGRRGDVGASGLERRRDNEVVAAIGEDSYTRPHTRRESVTTATDESVDRGARQMSDERFVPSKHQGFDRRGGSHQAYTTRESRGRGGARGGRGGAHGYSSQHLPNQQYINGQPMMQPYGYPTSRSPPGWQADQQSPYYPPGQTQSSKNFRGGSSRAQSIPTDAAYIRYGQVYGGVQPQMSPLQTFMGNMYDPQHAAQTMSAVPSCYSPFADQYSLFSMVSMQLEYYFSVDNLCKDVFLRKHMDSQGYVFLSLVANFKRVRQLTTDLELIKYVCYQSPNIEWRTAADGKDRLRRRDNWQQWVMPMEDREKDVQNDGPEEVTKPPAPVPQGFEQQMQGRHSVAGMPASAAATTAPWSTMNGTTAQYGMVSPTEPQNVQQVQQAQQAQAMMMNGYDGSSTYMTGGPGISVSSPPLEQEADAFSDAEAANLVIIVNKGPGIAQAGLPPATTRTFSNSSLDGRNSDETRIVGRQDSGPIPNGSISSRGRPGHPVSERTSSTDTESIRTYWVKDNDQPVDCFPSSSERERYPDVLTKALQERDEARKGFCPHNAVILYQFWSHFLIRNFNTRMYNEFRRLALDDLNNRSTNTGFDNLLKYYKEALNKEDYAIRQRVARHYVDLAKTEIQEDRSKQPRDRTTFKQLRAQWRDGATSLRNRKILAGFVDDSLRSALEASSDR